MSKHLVHAFQLQVYENKMNGMKKRHLPFGKKVYKTKSLIKKANFIK